MDDFFVFIALLTWIFRVTSFAFGVLIGLLAALGIAGGWRTYRRRVLRRNWRLDRPRHVWEGLVPEWRDYDPEIPEIAKRCVCHNRVIHPGERVLVWPEAGPAGLLHMAVYCETVKDRLWKDEHAEDAESAHE